MAVKKAPILQAYQVNMYCDKCGKRMKREEGIVLLTYPPKYSYSCECGNCVTSTSQYPHQIIEFDESKLEDVEV